MVMGLGVWILYGVRIYTFPLIIRVAVKTGLVLLHGTYGLPVYNIWRLCLQPSHWYEGRPKM